MSKRSWKLRLVDWVRKANRAEVAMQRLREQIEEMDCVEWPTHSNEVCVSRSAVLALLAAPAMPESRELTKQEWKEIAETPAEEQYEATAEREAKREKGER